MRRKRILITAALIGLCGVGGIVMAQRSARSGRSSVRLPARSTEPLKVSDYEGRAGVPVWETEKDFKSDHFTFVRIRYTSDFNRPGRRSRGGWTTDIPSSDMNFSFRLQQLTSLKVNPEPIILDLTDPELFNYPFIYMLEVGALRFSEDEVDCLRRYCMNGGFLMVDDFWGEDAWANFHDELQRVFPNRPIADLDISHDIFKTVYPLKKKPQIPAIDVARAYFGTNVTWEQEDAREPHYRAIFDDAGRMMVIVCQNTDLGDGWEREGEEEWYFHQFSEKQAYPMGINIIFYAMTH